MIHWHGLCWRQDKEPHHLLHEAIKSGLAEADCAKVISDWAKSSFGMSASHPAGKDAENQSRKNLWPPPEGTAPAPSEEQNPLVTRKSALRGTYTPGWCPFLRINIF